MAEWLVAVAGESFDNADGTSRQTILRRVRAGDPVRLVQEPDNPHDRHAVAVIHRAGQIGYVSREAGWVADRLERGAHLDARVHAVRSVPGGKRGAVIRVTPATQSASTSWLTRLLFG